ncbi:hypothetical protein JKP88DRAFT_252650 [Tribonema minus]|uniref:Uncharacterized protein n=1 Tax=Tribonema minus TaxID=303371 RepID=A0A836CLM0_9STRA|nr:hypothetical protein JKP88DRAFT_252650 [Tribonema minus]
MEGAHVKQAPKLSHRCLCTLICLELPGQWIRGFYSCATERVVIQQLDDRYERTQRSRRVVLQTNVPRPLRHLSIDASASSSRCIYEYSSIVQAKMMLQEEDSGCVMLALQATMLTMMLLTVVMVTTGAKIDPLTRAQILLLRLQILMLSLSSTNLKVVHHSCFMVHLQAVAEAFEKFSCYDRTTNICGLDLAELRASCVHHHDFKTVTCRSRCCTGLAHAFRCTGTWKVCPDNKTFCLGYLVGCDKSGKCYCAGEKKFVFQRRRGDAIYGECQEAKLLCPDQRTSCNVDSHNSDTQDATARCDAKGECVCFKGFTWFDTSTRICPDGTPCGGVYYSTYGGPLPTCTAAGVCTCAQDGFKWLPTSPKRPTDGSCKRAQAICPDNKSVCDASGSSFGTGVRCTAAGKCECTKAGATFFNANGFGKYDGYCIAKDKVCPNGKSYCDGAGNGEKVLCDAGGHCQCVNPERKYVLYYKDALMSAGQCLAPWRVCPNGKTYCTVQGHGNAHCDASGNCVCNKSNRMWIKLPSMEDNEKLGACAALARFCPNLKTYCTDINARGSDAAPPTVACDASAKCVCTDPGKIWISNGPAGGYKSGYCVESDALLKRNVGRRNTGDSSLVQDLRGVRGAADDRGQQTKRTLLAVRTDLAGRFLR